MKTSTKNALRINLEQRVVAMCLTLSHSIMYDSDRVSLFQLCALVTCILNVGNSKEVSRLNLCREFLTMEYGNAACRCCQMKPWKEAMNTTVSQKNISV